MQFAEFSCSEENVSEAFRHLFNSTDRSLESDTRKTLLNLFQSNGKKKFFGVLRAALDAAADPDDLFSISTSSLPVKNNSLDCLLYWDQDEFFAEQDSKELKRVLKPNGILIVIEISNANSSIHEEFMDLFQIAGISMAPVGALAALLHVLSGPVNEDFMELIRNPDGLYYGSDCNVYILHPSISKTNSEECIMKQEKLFALPFYDWRELFPDLSSFLEPSNFCKIVEEAHSIRDHWKSWPESHYGEGGSEDWKVFPFLHCFPANDIEKMTWIPATCEICPFTVALLRTLPQIRTALFSRLGGGTKISSHRGWSDLANDVLRCHISLAVPNSASNRDPYCGIWVEGQQMFHTTKEIIVFDDSKLHKAFNDSEEERLVLIVDIFRPTNIPRGTARKGMTAELEGFIAAFN